ncbi:hypothetical protein HKD37_06G017043 [Glycine soja]
MRNKVEDERKERITLSGVGDGGGDYHQLDGSQCLLLNVMITQMQQLLNRNNEELYRRIEGLEHQMNPNVGRPYGGNRRKFKDVFPNAIPHGLPLSRGIEHQFDLLLGASLLNRPGYKTNPQETQHKDAHAKVEYVKRLYDQVKVQFAKKNESYAKQANKNRKEEVLEPDDDPEHLRANVFQEGANDENPKTAQI